MENQKVSDERKIYEFITFLWDDVLSDQNKPFLSFKDGSPDETFFDYFNAKFDKHATFTFKDQQTRNERTRYDELVATEDG